MWISNGKGYKSGLGSAVREGREGRKRYHCDRRGIRRKKSAKFWDGEGSFTEAADRQAAIKFKTSRWKRQGCAALVSMLDPWEIYRCKRGSVRSPTSILRPQLTEEDFPWD